MKPFRYQKECVLTVEREFNGRALIAFDMGLGKSAISLWLAARARATPLIIVCPSAVKWQWQAEVKKVLGWKADVCEGRTPFPLKAKVVVINYEILKDWVEELRKLKPKMVVLDECQYIMNPKSLRTKAVLELCKRIRRVIALSGTPLINRPIELFPALRLLSRKTFSSRLKFGLEYCAGKRGYRGWDFNGASNTKKLNRILLDTCMARKRQEEALRDMPPKVRQVVPLDIRNRGEYQAAEKDFLEWLMDKDPKAAKRAARAQAITKSGYLLRLAARGKLKATVDWINEWLANTDRKMLVLSVHQKMVEAIGRRIDHGIITIDRTVTGRKRQAQIDRYQNDPSVRVLNGNITSLGTGLNLTAASAIAMVELPWQPGAVNQAEARAHRIGQTRGVNVYTLVARDTVEEKRCQVIQSKQEVISAVLDGGSVEGDLDVYTLLLNSLGVR